MSEANKITLEVSLERLCLLVLKAEGVYSITYEGQTYKVKLEFSNKYIICIRLHKNGETKLSLSTEDYNKFLEVLPDISKYVAGTISAVAADGYSTKDTVPIATKEIDPGAHYRFTYRGLKLDPARIGAIYGITHPMQFQALKKLLCTGKRGHKSLLQDITDIECCLQRWKEMLQEDETSEN